MILLIDNYDSFTWNLYQYFSELGADVQVIRNDAISTKEIAAMQPQRIVISPGPSTPNEAGVSLEVIKTFGATIPILGVCLGHQAIGQAFGGSVIRAPRPAHGKTDTIFHDGTGIFSSITNPFTATRYHSLIIDRAALPAELEVTAWNADGLIMGIRHVRFPIEGVQFHPESILTSNGKQMLKTFLEAPACFLKH